MCNTQNVEKAPRDSRKLRQVIRVDFLEEVASKLALETQDGFQEQ